MKRRGLLIAGMAVTLFTIACLWLGRVHSKVAGKVALVLVSRGTNQSSQATFCVRNDTARAIFLSWLIVETNSPTGWQVGQRFEPKDPRVVYPGKAHDLLVSVLPGPERWRLKVVYGTENQGPLLLMTKVELAIRNRRWSGLQSVGVFTGHELAVSEELGAERQE